MWLTLIALVIASFIYFKIKCTQFVTTVLWRGNKLPSSEEPTGLPSNVRYHKLKVIGEDFLGVYYTSPYDARKPVMIYCHGTMIIVEEQLFLFDLFAPYFNVVMFDYRGFGRSTGQSNVTVACWDILEVQRFAQTQYDVACVDVLCGSSLGSNAVLSYVRRCNYRHSMLPPKIVLMHPFFSLSETFSMWGLYSTLTFLTGDMDVHDVIPEYLAKNRDEEDLRVLIVGSDTDSVTPFKCARQIKEMCVFDSRLLLMEVGGQHFRPPETMYHNVGLLFGHSAEPLGDISEQDTSVVQQIKAVTGDGPLGGELVEHVEDGEPLKLDAQVGGVRLKGAEKLE